MSSPSFIGNVRVGLVRSGMIADRVDQATCRFAAFGFTGVHTSCGVDGGGVEGDHDLCRAIGLRDGELSQTNDLGWCRVRSQRVS